MVEEVKKTQMFHHSKLNFGFERGLNPQMNNLTQIKRALKRFQSIL